MDVACEAFVEVPKELRGLSKTFFITLWAKFLVSDLTKKNMSFILYITVVNRVRKIIHCSL